MFENLSGGDGFAMDDVFNTTKRFLQLTNGRALAIGAV
jgi:hypothetical protein